MLHALDRLSAEEVPGITSAASPFFSPDGRWIGFVANNEELFKVSVNGGRPVSLCRTGAPLRGASWGPDGTIVFATTDLMKGLMTVPEGGGVPSVLTTPDLSEGERGHWFPSFLPDGRGVLFTSAAPGSAENNRLSVLDMQSRTTKTLLRGAARAEYVEGGYLAYIAEPEDELRVVRFDPASLSLIGEPVTVADQPVVVGSGSGQFSLSGTGALAYLSNDGASQPLSRSLVWIDRRGREEPIHAPHRNYAALRLSPDGSLLALDVRDQEYDIWTWDLVRQVLTRITFGPDQDRFPVWAPDGRRIVFDSPRDGGASNLWVNAGLSGPLA